MNLDKFLNENQDPEAVTKLSKKLSDLLTSNETIDYIAVQKKPAVNISPDCIALTNRRIIFCYQKNLGLTFDFQDYQWRDVANCTLKENLLGSVFTLKTVLNTELTMEYIPKAQGRKLYAMAQEQEEAQREFRRNQELEEKRASAGNINVSTPPEPIISTPVVETPPPPVVEPQKNAHDKMIETLQKLKIMFESGLITHQEYENKKQEILNSL